jgi:hypothetical protein
MRRVVGLLQRFVPRRLLRSASPVRSRSQRWPCLVARAARRPRRQRVPSPPPIPGSKAATG